MFGNGEATQGGCSTGQAISRQNQTRLQEAKIEHARSLGADGPIEKGPVSTVGALVSRTEDVIAALHQETTMLEQALAAVLAQNPPATAGNAPEPYNLPTVLERQHYSLMDLGKRLSDIRQRLLL